jgi:hypothetical protein
MAASNCCLCNCKWTERYVYGTLYLDRIDPNGIYSPISPGSGYRWKYSGDSPQNDYSFFSLTKVMRYLYIDPKTTTNCSCISVANGRPIDKDEVYEDSTTEDLGKINKRFPGYWERFGSPNIFGIHNVIYQKTLQWDNSRARYECDHWCGPDPSCQSFPWPDYWKYDKRTEFRRECTRMQ